MGSNLDKYQRDLERLLKAANILQLSLSDSGRKKLSESINENTKFYFSMNHEVWYSEAHSVVKQILPDRLIDFVNLYKLGKRKKVDAETYGIYDHVLGLKITRSYTGAEVFSHEDVVFAKFYQQIQILNSAKMRFESTLFDIGQLVLADILDSEVAQARELKKHGFLRVAGTVIGVALEKHLNQVCQNHKVTIRKKRPTISDFNDSLKNPTVLDTPDWRFIQRLADLRNLCGHNNDREPTENEIDELIDGAEKITKTLF